jgi:hypothetical protein
LLRAFTVPAGGLHHLSCRYKALASEPGRLPYRSSDVVDLLICGLLAVTESDVRLVPFEGPIDRGSAPGPERAPARGVAWRNGTARVCGIPCARRGDKGHHLGRMGHGPRHRKAPAVPRQDHCSYAPAKPFWRPAPGNRCFNGFPDVGRRASWSTP